MTQAAHPAIGPFHIERELGRGGMGVVYLARDSRLDRQVAIKVLPPDLVADPIRLERFQREAKILASLNHPNIGAIHGLEEAHGRQHLVLEYIEGETLADRLQRGALPFDEALPIAKQIADALEAAHEKGIIHRDLKPGNVMVTPDGKVKVLDFGLARTAETPASSSSATPNSPTVTTPMGPYSPTIPGAIMGTAGYMSPEQARGKSVDKRSDIFSFGCVLYEMLTGSQPFGGETVADSIGAVLHKSIDLGLLPPATPPLARHVLRRCLERDRTQRYRDIADVRIELEHAASAPPDSPARRPAPSAARLLAWSFPMLLVGAAGAYLVLRSRGSSTPDQPAVFASIDPAPGTIILASGDVAGPAVISPDGRAVAYAARDGEGARTVWLRFLGRAEPETLRGTENAVFPFWSPDGRSLAFFADGKLRRIDLATRAVRSLCDAPGGRGGAWLDGGTIVFSPAFQSGVFRVSADGGAAEPVTTVDPARFSSHRWPSAIAGTDRFVYLAVNHDPAKREEISAFLASADGRLNKELIQTPFSAQVVGNHLLYLRESTLLAVSIDSAAGTLRGEPIPVVDGLDGDYSTWNAGFSASTTGSLVYRAAPRASSQPAPTTLEASMGEFTRATVLDRNGRASSVVADGMLQNVVNPSPDGMSIAVSGRWPHETGAASYDIWIFSPFAPGTDWKTSTFIPRGDGAPPRRFTFMPGDEISPCWSPDGKTLAFGKLHGPDPQGLFVKPVDGGPERLVLEAPSEALALSPIDWSRDGRYIIVRQGPFVGEGTGILAIPASGGTPIEVLTEPVEDHGGVSNDNKWLAFDSGGPDEREVSVVPFLLGWEEERAAGKPVPGAGDRYRVSIAGGTGPAWGTNGDTLYYVSSSNSVIAVRWSTDGARFAIDSGRALFDYPFEHDSVVHPLPGDDFFIGNAMLTPPDTQLRLILNWPALLKR